MEHSGMYRLGFLFGLLTALAVAALVVYLLKRGRAGKCEYDERQELIRGRGFKAAFYTQLIYFLVNFVLRVGLEFEWADNITMDGIGICLSVMVFALTCIQQNAYFPLNQKPKRYLLLFAGLMIMNLGIGFMNLSDGRVMWTDGKLNFLSMSFVCVGMFLILFVVLAFHALRGRDAEEDEA